MMEGKPQKRSLNYKIFLWSPTTPTSVYLYRSLSVTISGHPDYVQLFTICVLYFERDCKRIRIVFCLKLTLSLGVFFFCTWWSSGIQELSPNSLQSKKWVRNMIIVECIA